MSRPGEILFLAHRVPFPPDRGDKIRSHNLLRALADLAPVHVATFGETDADMAQAGELARVAQSHCLVRRRMPVPLAALEALAGGKPVSLPAFASLRLANWIRRTLAERPIAAIVVFSGQMAQYLPRRFDGPVLMDFVDVDSAKFEDYAARAPIGLSAMYRREAKLLGAFEAAVASRVTACSLASNSEAALFAGRLAEAGVASHVIALDNGIDTETFDPARVSARIVDARAAAPRIVFTGQMDYPPNVEAVAMFAREVMPLIRAKKPEVVFDIVGRAPTAAVRALDGVNGTRVHGAVQDVRPWLADATLVVAPLLIARGVQNKVLEAMAMARPVLATSAAATGIDAVDGVEIAVADGADALAARALDLIARPRVRQRMGKAARAKVVAERSWAAALAPLGDLLGLAGPVGRARDAA